MLLEPYYQAKIDDIKAKVKDLKADNHELKQFRTIKCQLSQCENKNCWNYHENDPARG